MPAVIQLLPAVTITTGSSFALDGTATPANTSVAIAQSTFTVYGVALASGATEPTGADIEAGTGAIATASANAIASLNFTGLTPSTTYDFYLVGKDGDGEYTAVTKITATTTGVGFNPAIFIGAGIL
jgi:hypothetical protein